MFFWLITHLEDSATTKQILGASAAQGWRCDHVVPRRQNYLLTATSIEELFPGEVREKPDFCYVRMGSSAFIEGFALLSKIASLGVPCINSPEHLIVQRDKAQALLTLSQAGIPTPRTLVIGRSYSKDSIFRSVSGPPWVLKSRFGAKGDGVMLVESERSLTSALDWLFGTYPQVLLQEFIAAQAGTDIRVLVVAGKAIAAMRRSAPDKNEFRSNLFLGGRGQRVELTAELTTLAEDAASALGLTIAGVDILGEAGSYVVCEVNSSPGLKGLSDAMGEDLALEVVPRLFSAVTH